MHKMTLYFDPVSPWARVGLYVVSRYTKVWNLDLTLHPVNLGYIMKDSGNRPPVQVPNKGKWMWEDMERAEKFYGVKLRTPAGFPVNTMPSQCVLRSLLDEPKYKSLILPSTFAISDAMWGGPDLPVQTAEELYKILGPIWEKEGKGQELKDLLEKVLTKEHRDRLKKEAKEVVDDKGAFGAPWMVVTRKDGATSHWFGSDRFEQMAAWLGEPYKGPFADNRPAAKL